jgi:hypothetical protein
LLNEAGGGASFSISALLLLIWRSGGNPISAEILAFFSMGGLLFLALLAVWLAWRGWFHGRDPHRNATDILALYLLQALNFRLWYTAWPFPFVLLDESHGRGIVWRRHTAVWFLYLTQLSPLITGHLWAYALGGNHLLMHALAIPFTFILPPCSRCSQ